MNLLRSKNQIAKYDDDLSQVIQETFKLWRKHHLSYQQTKYVVEQVRKQLELKAQKSGRSVVNRLSKAEADKLIDFAYRGKGQYGLLIKVLFFSGARVNEFVNIKVEDVFFDDHEILITHGKGDKKRYVPILPEITQEIKSYLGGRDRGYLFESNRHTKFTTRRIQQIIKKCAQQAGITKKVYPHLLRHSVATILRQKGMALDLIQKFLGHAKIQTTQIYSEAPDEMMKSLYREALS
jgi:integrase/recombinase XerD